MNSMSTGGRFGRCVNDIIGLLLLFGLLFDTFFNPLPLIVIAFEPLHRLFWEPLKKKEKIKIFEIPINIRNNRLFVF